MTLDDSLFDDLPAPRTKQGQSLATVAKEARVTVMLAVSMRIFNAKLPGRPYFHFDANAGSGFNDIVDVPGSPVVAVECAIAHLPSMRFYGFFAEKDRSLAVALQRRLAARRDCYIFNADNEDVIRVFAKYIADHDRPEYAVGTLLVDPNGCYYRSARNDGPPSFRLLSEFFAIHPRIDVCLNLNLLTYWRQIGAGHSGVISLGDIVGNLGKRHWRIAASVQGQHRFVQLMGSNLDMGGNSNLGLHRISTEEGARLFRWANREDRREKSDDGLLFDLP